MMVEVKPRKRRGLTCFLRIGISQRHFDALADRSCEPPDDRGNPIAASGSRVVTDPSIIMSSSVDYLFSSGPDVQVGESTDVRRWTSLGMVRRPASVIDVRWE
jgi:hypothetical protein